MEYPQYPVPKRVRFKRVKKALLTCILATASYANADTYIPPIDDTGSTAGGGSVSSTSCPADRKAVEDYFYGQDAGTPLQWYDEDPGYFAYHDETCCYAGDDDIIDENGNYVSSAIGIYCPFNSEPPAPVWHDFSSALDEIPWNYQLLYTGPLLKGDTTVYNLFIRDSNTGTVVFVIRRLHDNKWKRTVTVNLPSAIYGFNVFASKIVWRDGAPSVQLHNGHNILGYASLGSGEVAARMPTVGLLPYVNIQVVQDRLLPQGHEKLASVITDEGAKQYNMVQKTGYLWDGVPEPDNGNVDHPEAPAPGVPTSCITFLSNGDQTAPEDFQFATTPRALTRGVYMEFIHLNALDQEIGRNKVWVNPFKHCQAGTTLDSIILCSLPANPQFEYEVDMGVTDDMHGVRGLYSIGGLGSGDVFDMVPPLARVGSWQALLSDKAYGISLYDLRDVVEGCPFSADGIVL